MIVQGNEPRRGQPDLPDASARRSSLETRRCGGRAPRVDRHMEIEPVDVSTLPPFSNMRARCAACGAGREIRVHFDRGCRFVTGGVHFHRLCGCGHSWVEQCSEAGASAASADPPPIARCP
jgi:hypothetical protein